jgi:putative PIG3 family NAD(P)H quinone oxidoreductase
MRAVVIRGSGGPEVLAIEEREAPRPCEGEVRIEVAAAGLNRADLLQRRGFYPAPPGTVADVPGLEYAGTIVETGEGVAHTRVGDHVMGLVAGGAMATELVVPEPETMPLPEPLSLVEAAAVPEVFATVWDAVFVQAGLRAGQTLLVHAIGSGIGTAAIQLARAFGARILGTSRTESKLAHCAALGLDAGIVVGKEAAFAPRVAELTNGAMADVILDTVGASYLDENVRALAPCGTIVVIGLVGGISGTLPLGVLLGKRARIVGSTLRSRGPTERRAVAEGFTRELVPLFEEKKLVPVIEHVLPMGEIAKAHTLLESNETFGKVVLTW